MSFTEAQIAKGLRKQVRGDLASAIGHYRAALNRKPKHPRALYFYALACQQLKRMDEAIRAMQFVVKLAPKHADAWYNLGKFYHDTRQPDLALAHYIAALEQDDKHIEALTNAGNIYLEMGEPKVAEQCYFRALATDPTRAEARYNRSFVKLAMGDYETGWADYEARWNCLGHIAEHWRPEFMDSTPRWDGSPMPGKTLLLHWEQGFGDTIQFVRYLGKAKEQSQANVVLEVQQPLKQLIAESVDVPVYAWGEALPPCDQHASLMSLPALCGGFGDGASPYLDCFAQSFWPPMQPKTVGICWAGSSGHLNDHNRSLSIESLAPIFDVHGLRFSSLQVGERAGEAKAIPALEPMLPANNFFATACIISTRELVITVDTAIAHLAGALGVPVWILLPTNPDFRWMNEGDTTPWYPTARLFRQTKRGQWADVIERVANELRAYVGT